MHSGGACARVRRTPFVAHTRVSIFFPLAFSALVPFFSLLLPIAAIPSAISSFPPFFVGLLFQKGPGLMQISS